MNEKGNVILIICVIFFIMILVLIIFYFAYLNKEDKKEIKIEKEKYYIKATDYYTKENIEVNYVLIHNNTIIYNGTTNKEEYEEVNIDKNITQFTFMNFGSDYYTNSILIMFGNKKMDMELYPIGNVFINSDKGFNNNIKEINITTDKQLRKLAYCLRWSINFLEVRDLNNNRIDIPQRLKNKVDRCYYIGKTINKDEIANFFISYDKLNSFNELDFIELYIIDSNRNFKNEPIIEDLEGNDVGAKDYKFIIK